MPHEKSIKVYLAPGEFSFIPIVNDEELNSEVFEKLDKDEQARIEKDIAGLRAELRNIVTKQIPAWRKKVGDRMLYYMLQPMILTLQGSLKSPQILKQAWSAARKMTCSMRE